MEGVAREPSGRVSRSGIHHGPADAVAIAARMRHSGLTKALARDQKAATFIGRLSLYGPETGISGRQYDAIVSYLDLRAEYLRSIKAPDAGRDGEAAGGGWAPITAEYEDWVARVAEEYRLCRDAIQQEQNYSRENLWGALDVCVVRGVEAFHLVGALRIVGNALARHFRS